VDIESKVKFIIICFFLTSRPKVWGFFIYSSLLEQRSENQKLELDIGRVKRNWYRPGLENRYRETDVQVRVLFLPLWSSSRHMKDYVEGK
jgi:hypothetical protein